MRTTTFLVSALIALSCAAPALALAIPHEGKASWDSPVAGVVKNHTSPQPNAGRHEPPDPCRRYRARRAHQRCLATRHRQPSPDMGFFRPDQNNYRPNQSTHRPN
jgi:hypothetical protein